MTFIHLATRRDVVVRAMKTAVLVGVILVAINQGDALIAGQVDLVRLAKIALTFAVPYCVSTFASVSAIKDLDHGNRK